MSHAPAHPVPSDRRIKEFQALYWKKFGIEISYGEAGRVLGLLIDITWLGDQRTQESNVADGSTS